MLRTNRRRSSAASNSSGGGGGSSAWMSRRSSITLHDIAYIQAVISQTKRLTTTLVLAIVVLMPLLIYMHAVFTHRFEGSFEQLFINFDFRLFTPRLGNPLAWTFVGVTFFLQFVFFWLLPANTRTLRTASGDIATQRLNAFSALLLQTSLYGLGAALRIYSPDALFDVWCEVLVVLTLVCLGVQLYLHVMCPPEEAESNDAPIRVFFFGRQVQPLVLDIDVKAFLTNRVMCALWSCYLLAAITKQRLLLDRTTPALVVIVVLQSLYVSRRALADPCTSTSLDNQTDRAGFYRLAGVVAFAPTLHFTVCTVAAQTGDSTSLPFCVLLLILGIIAQLLTTSIDAQKAEFRRQNGNMKIDGHDPFYIIAKYRKETGEGATNLLLGSGFWGLARHINYTAEWTSFACWTLPLGISRLVVFVPLLILGLLLVARVSRDELRCLLKYQQNWIQLTNRVKYKLIPRVY